MRKHALIAAVLTALALPAGAQTTMATSSTTASSAALVASGQVLQQPDLSSERRVLAMAAFERPQAPRRADAFKRQAPNFEPPPLEPKEEWTSDEGLRLAGTRIAYKSRF